MTDKAQIRELAKPLRMKGVLLKNRMVFAPVSTRMAGLDGSVSDAMLAYYGDKASGGAAMVITETLHVDNEASRFTIVQPSVYHDRFIPRLSSLADVIRCGGALAIAQIGHAGRQSFYEANNREPVAPSRIIDGPTRHCHELTREEIETIILAFAAAARRAAVAGFDGIEIHAGNGYLINEFLSPFTNRRRDEYGRDRELLLTKVIDAVSARVDPGLILGLRLGCGDFVEGGLECEDAVRIGSRIPTDKIDYIHTSAGTADSFDYTIQPMYHERALLEDVARKLKGVSRIPIILTGSVNDPDLAGQVLARGSADLIGMGRPLLADPSLPLKVLRGRQEEVCPCIRCNQGCLARVKNHNTIRCSVNPELGYEHMKVFLSAGGGEGVRRFTGDGDSPQEREKGGLPAGPANRAAAVLVAGAGPAGIIAALRAEERGFRVILVEREERAGGLLNTSRAEAFKTDIVDYLEYLLRRIARSKIETRTSVSVDASVIRDTQPDILINAAGSVPLLPEVPGDLPYRVVDVRELLLHLEGFRKCRRIAVIGGGSAGCEAGLMLAIAGAGVTIFEQEADLLRDLDSITAMALRRMLKRDGVQLRTGTRFLGFEPEGIRTDRRQEPAAVDLAVVAMGSRPEKALDGAVGQDPRWQPGLNYLLAGDARKVGRIYEAVHDTYWGVSSLLASYSTAKHKGPPSVPALEKT